MTRAANLAGGLKAWIVEVEVDEGVTWFLFSLVYALGLNRGELGIEFSGILPQISVPHVSLALVFLCLVVSIVIFAGPLLPSRMRTGTEEFRCSTGYRHLRRWSAFFAFILGWLAGFTMISDAVPELLWLTSVIGYIGFGIFFVLLVRTAFGLGLELESPPER